MKKLKCFIAAVSFLTILFASCSHGNSSSGNSSGDDSKPKVSYSVGDIVLSDGTKVSKDKADSLTNEQKGKLVAVIYKAGDSGDALGLGLKQGEGLAWATVTTGASFVDVDAIECTKPASTSNSEPAFDGDTDGGYNNWAAICQADSKASKDLSTKYPIFSFAENYGKTNSLTGEYETGWFVPSIKELYELSLVLTEVNSILEKIGNTYATKIDNANTTLYWSSSQSKAKSDEAINYYFDTTQSSQFNTSTKSNTTNVKVLVIKKF